MSEITEPKATSIVVETEAGKVTVRKLALGDYAGVLRALDKLPQAVGDVFKKDKAEINEGYLFSLLPTLVADHLQEFAGILAATTDRDAEFFVKQLDLADAIEVLTAALELNDYSRIAGLIKKLRAGRRPKNPTVSQ